MNATEAQHYVRRHNCSCGNALSFRGAGQTCEVMCPGNPDHREFVKVLSPTEQYRAGHQLHPSVQRNIERRMGVTDQPGQLDSKALMVIGETAMAERLDVAMKAQFGFALDQSGRACTPTPGQIKALVIYCATYGLDPLRHEVVLFGGNPLVGLDAYRRKATETGDYLGCSHKPVVDPALKEALGYEVSDLVVECTVKRLVKGHVAEFSRYGGVRRKEIDAMSQSGNSPRHPVLHKYSAEMAQNRAEKHALRAAFQLTFADAEAEAPIESEYTVVEEKGAIPSASGPPVTPSPAIASEPLPVSTDEGRATDGHGQSPDLEPADQAGNETQPPSSTSTSEQLSFAATPEPEVPQYTIPETLQPSQFQYLMGQMQVPNKATMNRLLGLKPDESFQGTARDAVDAVFASLLAKGGIPQEIKHWAQWLEQSR